MPLLTWLDGLDSRQLARLQRALLAAAFLGSLAVALAGAGIKSAHDPRTFWFFGDTPLGTSRHLGVSRPLSLGGLLLLAAGWLGLGLCAWRRGTSRRTVLLFAALVALPLAVAPPLFSDDVFSYVAQGQLIRAGFDPYTHGWAALGQPGIGRTAADFWQSTPTPYSPGFLRLAQLVAWTSGGSAYAGGLVLRVVAVLALAACAALLLRLLAARPDQQVPALWLAIANPLVLTGAVSGAHIDVLIAVALLGALVLHRSGRGYLALGLVGVAGQVKVTALLAALALAADLALRERGRLHQLLVWARGGLVAAASFAGLSLVAGLGWGWLHALSVPGLADTSATPLDAASDLVARVSSTTRASNQNQAVNGAPGWVTTLGLLVGLAVCLALALRVRQLGPARAVGLSVLAVLLLGGAFWPWYLIVPLVLLAVAGERTDRLMGAALSLVLLFADGPGGLPNANTHTVAADVWYLGWYAGAVALLVVGRRWGRTGASPLTVRRRADPPGQLPGCLAVAGGER